jgi:hypothetical protein
MSVYLSFLAFQLSCLIAIAVANLPLELPDGTTPVTCRVSIYDSSTDSKVGVGLLMDKAVVPALPSGSLYMEEVHAKVHCLFIGDISSLLILWKMQRFSYFMIQ